MLYHMVQGGLDSSSGSVIPQYSDARGKLKVASICALCELRYSQRLLAINGTETTR